jgi:glyoxylase-like metal-dependent hydrolase (beta-lactamase superfamily II)
MSLHAVEAEQAMGARIIPFLEKVTETFSYLVIDPPTQAAAIIDPVLDYDPAAGRIRTHSADAIAKMVQSEGLQVERILETHVHADHLSAAGYLKKKLGGALGIGSNVREVQRILGNLFNEKPANPPGAGFDQLFEDGETFRVGTLDVKALYTPGHTPADMCYMLEDAVFAGDTLFMPDYGTARCDFPGGDARTLYRSIQRLLELPANPAIHVPRLCPWRARLCVRDNRRRRARAKRPCPCRRHRRRIRRAAYRARCNARHAEAFSAVAAGQYAGRRTAAARVERPALFQDPDRGFNSLI